VGGASYFYSTLTALDLSIRDITSNGQIYTSNNVASTGSTSGALRVTGGAGVQGNLYVGGTVNAISTSTNSTVFAVSGTQASTSSITGSATFAGGIGVGANSYFGANMTIAGTTDSSSSTVGALTVAGGLGVSKNIYVGGNAAITGTLTSNTGLNVYGGNGLLAASNVSTQRSGTSVTTAGMIVQTGLVCQTNAVLPRGWIALGAPLPLSSSTYKFGSKSLDLTGTAGTLGGSYISLPNFWPSMNTGNWTLEFWLYHTCTATSSFPNIVSTGLSAIMVQARDTNLLISLASAGSYNIANAVASPALTANAWNHVALIFDGSAYYCYVHNGTSSSRTTIATSSLTLNIITSTVTYGYWAIGTSNNGKGQIGYIDDFRLSNTVRYSTASSSHTPPASQLSWDSSTVTLNNFEAADCVSGAQCNFGLVVGSGLPATSSTSAALAVTGGAGVTGDVYVGGSMNLTTPLGVASGGLGLNTSATASGAIPYTSATGTWSTLAKGTDGYVLTLVSGLPAWQAASSGTNMASLYVSGNVDATSASTGSITTAGGIGVAKSVYVGNQLTVGGASYFFASTASTSSTTGAITVTGGIGVAGNSYFGGTLNVLSNVTTASRNFFYENGNWVVNTPAQVSFTGTGSTTFSSTGYFQVPSLGSLFTTSSAFTIEFTFSYASGTGGTILGNSSNGNIFRVYLPSHSAGAATNVKIDVGNGTNYTGYQFTTSGSLPISTATTVVIQYSSGAWWGFVNGSAINGTNTPLRTSNNYQSAFLTNMTVHYNTGDTPEAGLSFTGFRVSSGLLYSIGSSTITPASAPYSVTSATVLCNNFTLPISGLVSTNSIAEYLNASELVYSGSGNNSVFAQGATFSKPITVSNYTASSSTTTGALTVNGGIGAQGNLYVGGTTTLSTPLGAASGGLGINTSATAAGALPYTSGTGTWSTLAAATNGYALVLSSGVPAWSPQYTTEAGYAELIGSSNQSISATTNTAVQFGTINSNSFSSSTLTITGTGNTTFTNVSGRTIIVEVSATYRTNVNYSGMLNIWIYKNGGGTFYGQQLLYVTGSTSGAVATQTTLSLAANDYFQIICWTSSATSIGGGGANASVLNLYLKNNYTTAVSNSMTTLSLSDASASSNSTTGALQVAGGISTQKDLWAGGSFFTSDTGGTGATLKIAATGGSTYIESGAANSSGSAAPLNFTSMNASATWMTLTSTDLWLNTANLHVASGGTNYGWLHCDTTRICLEGQNSSKVSLAAGGVEYLEVTTSGVVRALATTNSSSTTSGAFQCNGGIGVQGNGYFSGGISAGTNSTASYFGANVQLVGGANLGDTYLRLRSSTDNNHYLTYIGGAIDGPKLAGNAAVVFATTASGDRLLCNSSGVTYYGGLTNGSDRRIKDNIISLDLDHCKSFIAVANPVSFTFKRGDGVPTYGFIAQEVRDAGFTDLVKETPYSDMNIEDDGSSAPGTVLTMSYTSITPILTKVVQSILVENAALKQQVNDQQAQITALQAKLDALISVLGVTL
jgi:hypothetical protein